MTDLRMLPYRIDPSHKIQLPSLLHLFVSSFSASTVAQPQNNYELTAHCITLVNTINHRCVVESPFCPEINRQFGTCCNVSYSDRLLWLFLLSPFKQTSGCVGILLLASIYDHTQPTTASTWIQFFALVQPSRILGVTWRVVDPSKKASSLNIENEANEIIVDVVRLGWTRARSCLAGIIAIHFGSASKEEFHGWFSTKDSINIETK